MTTGQRPASTRAAIASVTAWLDSPAGPPDLMVDYLIGHLDGQSPRNSLSRAVELIMGFTYLSGSLLVMLEDATGLPAQEILRNLALEYAQPAG